MQRPLFLGLEAHRDLGLVFLEFFIAIFRVAETNAELVALKRLEMGLDVPPPAEPVADGAS